MIKIKYIFDFLIFPLKRRYFGYNKTIGGSPSIEALSPLLEDICNCGKKKKQLEKVYSEIQFWRNFRNLSSELPGISSKDRLSDTDDD